MWLQGLCSQQYKLFYYKNFKIGCYKINTVKDYQGRIECLCKQENITLENLVTNINSILPIYEAGEKFAYGNRSHTSVKQALRRFNKFLNTTA